MSRMQILFGFSGRIARTQFWLGTLVMTVLTILISALMAGLLSIVNDLVFIYIAYGLVTLFLCWSGLAIYAKRLHDHDKSALWILIGLIPIIGQLWLIIKLGFMPGTQAANRYGDPMVKSQEK